MKLNILSFSYKFHKISLFKTHLSYFIIKITKQRKVTVFAGCCWWIIAVSSSCADS